MKRIKYLLQGKHLDDIFHSEFREHTRPIDNNETTTQEWDIIGLFYGTANGKLTLDDGLRLGVVRSERF